jgi:hypothetical protein
VLAYGGLPSNLRVIALTQLPPSAQPMPVATTEAEPTPAAPSVEPACHPVIASIVRLLARQAAQEHLATEAARHG